MKEDRTGGASGAETSDIAAFEAPGRERRMTAKRKQEVVLRVLRGEPLETVAREMRVTAADLSGWRDLSLEGGAASLKSRPRDDRDDRIVQPQAKLGEITMDNELLYENRLLHTMEQRQIVKRSRESTYGLGDAMLVSEITASCRLKLSGTLSLGRTNAFFLGGGKGAMAENG